MIESIFSIGSIVAVIDIVIVAVIIYWLMLMFKGTRAERMLIGLAVIVILYFVSQRAELLTVHWILSNFLGSIAIFVIVVFQQDIRRALVNVGKPFITRDIMGTRGLLEEITRAVSAMAKKKTGCIVAIERSIDLGDVIDIGIEVDAKVSRELLLSVFNTSSPLHDGAVVVRNGRIYKAGCILPLTEKELSSKLGTRHRAAVGLAEETDAAIIVVSEETGEITLVVEDDLKTGLDADALLSELKRLFSAEWQRKNLLAWKAGA